MLNTSPSQDGPFPYSTSVRLNNRTKPRLAWIFSYICCNFVHPDLISAPLFVEMRERSITDSQGTNAIWDKLYSFQLALTNRAGGLYGSRKGVEVPCVQVQQSAHLEQCSKVANERCFEKSTAGVKTDKQLSQFCLIPADKVSLQLTG